MSSDVVANGNGIEHTILFLKKPNTKYRRNNEEILKEAGGRSKTLQLEGHMNSYHALIRGDIWASQV